MRSARLGHAYRFGCPPLHGQVLKRQTWNWPREAHRSARIARTRPFRSAGLACSDTRASSRLARRLFSAFAFLQFRPWVNQARRGVAPATFRHGTGCAVHDMTIMAPGAPAAVGGRRVYLPLRCVTRFHPGGPRRWGFDWPVWFGPGHGVQGRSKSRTGPASTVTLSARRSSPSST